MHDALGADAAYLLRTRVLRERSVVGLLVGQEVDQNSTTSGGWHNGTSLSTLLGGLDLNELGRVGPKRRRTMYLTLVMPSVQVHGGGAWAAAGAGDAPR
eukprot:scaffold4423_cov344-Prasinococcus_capsulatus_cf.AAC.7